MKYLTFILLVLSFSCTPTQNVETKKEEPKEDMAKCETLGTVKDFTGLDGCGLLIVLESGRKLEPVVIEDKNFKLRDGQKIRFNYKAEREVMSICMGGMTVRITCIEEIE